MFAMYVNTPISCIFAEHAVFYALAVLDNDEKYAYHINENTDCGFVVYV